MLDVDIMAWSKSSKETAPAAYRSVGEMHPIVGGMATPLLIRFRHDGITTPAQATARFPSTGLPKYDHPRRCHPTK